MRPLLALLAILVLVACAQYQVTPRPPSVSPLWIPETPTPSIELFLPAIAND